jgi:hypothetical protein
MNTGKRHLNVLYARRDRVALHAEQIPDADVPIAVYVEGHTHRVASAI